MSDPPAGDRAAFLARVGQHLSGGTPRNIAHPLITEDHIDPVPAVRYTRDLSDPVQAFLEATARLGAHGRLLPDDAAVAAFVAEIVGNHQVRRAVRSADPEVAAALPALEAAGVEVADLSIAVAAEVDLGVTGAAWGVAATGSVVLLADRAGGRTAGLLPPVHLCLVAADNIVADAAAIFRGRAERLPDGPPSQMVFATGPSRSGDIELVLTVGVHGPGTVYVGVLGGAVRT